MRTLFAIIISCFTISSCSYEIVKEKDTSGKVYKERFYKDREKQEQYFNKQMFKAWYKEGYYPKTTSLALIGDSIVKSDSMEFLIRNHDSSFTGLFFKGIISGNVFDSVSRPSYTLQRTEIETGIVTPSRKITGFVVYGFKVMDYFNIPDNRMRIKFTAAQAKWWIEIESAISKKSGTLKDFIDNSRLVFIHTYCCEI
jgi:hypothetical protein